MKLSDEIKTLHHNLALWEAGSIRARHARLTDEFWSLIIEAHEESLEGNELIKVIDAINSMLYQTLDAAKAAEILYESIYEIGEYISALGDTEIVSPRVLESIFTTHLEIANIKLKQIGKENKNETK